MKFELSDKEAEQLFNLLCDICYRDLITYTSTKDVHITKLSRIVDIMLRLRDQYKIKCKDNFIFTRVLELEDEILEEKNNYVYETLTYST